MADEKRSILIIDDDDIQHLTARTMLGDDYEILSAKSGIEALEFFRQGHIPNLVLLDILMPEMDGWEIFNRIRAISLLEDVPIAFLTSLNGTAEENRARELGAADYIIKPFSKEGLLTRIKNIIDN
jgi:CheY-like chemotaxis protein